MTRRPSSRRGQPTRTTTPASARRRHSPTSRTRPPCRRAFRAPARPGRPTTTRRGSRDRPRPARWCSCSPTRSASARRQRSARPGSWAVPASRFPPRTTSPRRSPARSSTQWGIRQAAPALRSPTPRTRTPLTRRSRRTAQEDLRQHADLPLQRERARRKLPVQGRRQAGEILHLSLHDAEAEARKAQGGDYGHRPGRQYGRDARNGCHEGAEEKA